MGEKFWFVVRKIFDKISSFNNEEDDLNGISCGMCKRVMIDASQITCGCKFCRQCIQNYLNNGGTKCPVKFNVNCLNISFHDNNDFHTEKDANKKIRKLVFKCPIQDCDIESNLELLVEHWLNVHKEDTEVSVLELNEEPEINVQKCEYIQDCPIVKEPENEVQIYNNKQDDAVDNLRNKVTVLKKRQTKLERTIIEMKEIINSLELDKLNLVCNIDRVLSIVNQLESRFEDDKYMPFIWNVNGFNRHKIDDVCLYSEPFFVSKNGYKMRLMMYPNGAFKENDFVSIYFEIVRGEFDSFLKWPFCCNVTLKLLDKNGDTGHNHTLYYLHHRERRYVYQRPKTAANIGLGASQFIEYARIIDSTKPLLFNDTLSVLCSVEEAPLSLAWVE